MSNLSIRIATWSFVVFSIVYQAGCFKDLPPLTKSEDASAAEPKDRPVGTDRMDATTAGSKDGLAKGMETGSAPSSKADSRLGSGNDSTPPGITVDSGINGNAAVDAPVIFTPEPTVTSGTLKGLGDGCKASPECQSGYCVDSLCCDSPCTGACQSCKQNHTGKEDGSCAPVGPGKDPYDVCIDERATNECGLDGLCDGQGGCRKVDTSHVCQPADCKGALFTPVATCDGVGACRKPEPHDCGTFQCSPSEGCKKTCSSAADCGAGSYCDLTTKTCSVKRVEGKTCNSTDECVSGFCVDGVCCKTSCEETCKACAEVFTGQASGTCYAVKPATDPKNSCAEDKTNPCGDDGLCNGAGACAKAGSSEVCAPAVCKEEQFTPEATCDGKGACKKVTQVSCGGFGCSLEGCKKSCASTNDCAAGSYCDTAKKQCLAKKVEGKGCAAAEECSSGFCVDGVCCKTACTEGCYACANELTGQASGTCNPVTDGTDPKNKCSPDSKITCGNDGDCDGAGACRKAKTNVECGPASCDADNNFIAASFCNGSGACNNAKVTACGSVACSPTGGCPKGCTTDGNCLEGNYCSSKVCVPKKKPGASCSADNQCDGGPCVSGICCKSACPKAAASTCGLTGECDSSGNCKKYDADTSCAVAKCSTSTGAFTPAAVCDGLGKCNNKTATPCAPLACTTSGCLEQCTSDSQCVSGRCSINKKCESCGALGKACCIGTGAEQCGSLTCDAGKCVDPGLDNGQTCSSGTKCKSGNCVDGVCCDDSCTAACRSCNLSGKVGTCSSDTNGTSCGPNAVCNAGTCSSCVQDQACNTSTLCQVWKTDCSSGTSKCTKRSNLATNTSCGSSTCSGNTKTEASKCDSGGNCVPGSKTNCPNGCNGTNCAALLAEGGWCSSNGQCQSGACGLGEGTTNVHNICDSLAGTENQRCYFDSTCRGSSLVCSGNAYGFNLKCVPCGASGVKCCPGSTCASAGLFCDSGYCQSCGTNSYPGNKCCPGSVCLSGYTCVDGYCRGQLGSPCPYPAKDCVFPYVCSGTYGGTCVAP